MSFSRRDSISVLLLLVFIVCTYFLAPYLRNHWLDMPTSVSSDHSDFKKRLPTAIIIGVQKGGTRALISFLSHHPSIVSPLSEIHYFSKEYNFDSDDVTYRNYRKKMPRSIANQITMEKSPSYFDSKKTPRRMYNYQQHLGKKLKLLITFVHPVKRAVSHFFHSLRRDNKRHVMKTHNLTEALLMPLQQNHFLKAVTSKILL